MDRRWALVLPIVAALTGCASSTALPVGATATDATTSWLPAAIGYQWRVTAVADARGAVPIPVSRHPVIGYTRDGWVIGDDTLNAVEGRYVAVPGGYRVEDSASTAVGSAGGPDRVVAAVDEMFIPVVAAPAERPAPLIVRAAVGGDTLTLSRGTTTLTLHRGAAQPDFGPASSTPAASAGH